MINLVFSTCDRFELFEDTLTSLVNFNPSLNNLIEYVYVLDDRSPYKIREKIEKLVNLNFPHKGRLITFNDSRKKFSYVEKLNFLQNISLDAKYTLFIEEDWKNLSPLNLTNHVQFLENNPNIDQIIFSEHFWLQNEETKEKTSINETYWDHSKVEYFKHVNNYGIDENGAMYFIWNQGIPMFSLNPSLNRNTIYSGTKFPLTENYEHKFSLSNNITSILTKQGYFVHTGALNSKERNGN